MYGAVLLADSDEVGVVVVEIVGVLTAPDADVVVYVVLIGTLLELLVCPLHL